MAFVYNNPNPTLNMNKKETYPMKRKTITSNQGFINESEDSDSGSKQENRDIVNSKLDVKQQRASRILALKDNYSALKNINNAAQARQRRQSQLKSTLKGNGTLDKQQSISDTNDNQLKDDEPSMTLRQFLDKIFTLKKRNYFDGFIAIMSLCSFTIYLVLTYYPENLYYLDFLDYIFCSIYFLDFVIYILLAQHRLQFLLTLNSLIKMLCICPLLMLSFQLDNVNSITHSTVTSLINTTRIFRLIRVFQLFYIVQSEQSDVRKQVMMIICTITLIVVISSGLLQIAENEEINVRIKAAYNDFDLSTLYLRTQFHHYSYFCIITISTVGFGDIVPYTTLGKGMVVLLVLITIALIPKQTNELIQIISAESEYFRSRYKSSSDIKHIVITGDITSDSLQSFCLELFHSDHGSQYKHAIIVSLNVPSREIESLIHQKQYENFIRWLQGDPMNEKDLNRSDISKAKACVILNSKYSLDPYSSDHKNILLALYIKKYVYSIYDTANMHCSFRLILQLIKPENKYHYYNSLQKIYKERMPPDNLIIIEEIKMNLLAKSCLTPGIMSMLSNLVMSSSTLANNDDDWLKEYSEGRAYEIYRIPLSDNYKYVSFLEIVKEVYAKEHALAFAIEVETHKTSVIKLNPGNVSIDSILKATKLNTDDYLPRFNLNNIKLHLYLICLDKQVAENSCGIISTSRDPLSTGKRGQPIPSSPRQFMIDKPTSNRGSFNKFTKGPLSGTSVPSDSKIVQNLQKLCTQYDYARNQGNDSLSDLSDISDNDDFIDKKPSLNSYEDYEIDLDNYFTMKNFDPIVFNPNVDIMQHTIKDSKKIMDHILVCGIHPSMFHFILPLRAKYLGHQSLKYIVILGENLTESLYNDLAKFPYIVYIQGSPLLPENLYRANIMNAEIAVILSNSNIKADYEDSNDNQTLDAETIFIYKAIKKCNKNIQIMTELVSADNIEYLLQKNNSEINSKEMYEYSQLFASGEVFTPGIIDRITCQIYYNPNILTILEQILNGGATNKNKKVLRIERELNLPSSNFYLLQMPEAFIGETFEKLFSHLIDSNYVIPLGLYRRSVKDDFFYVYTNPAKQSLLRSSDLVYVLGQTSNIQDLLEDKDDSKEENPCQEKNTSDSTSSRGSAKSLNKKDKDSINKILKRPSIFAKKESRVLASSNRNIASKEGSGTNSKPEENLSPDKRNNMKKQGTFISKLLPNMINKENTKASFHIENTKNQILNANTNDKLSSKYLEFNRVKEMLQDIKDRLSDLKKEYNGFDSYIQEIVSEEIASELNIYLENK